MSVTKTPEVVYASGADPIMSDAKVLIREILDIANDAAALVDQHIANSTNPHAVTKAQIGLSNVNNTSDTDKPVSTSVNALVSNVQSNLDSQISGLQAAINGHTSATALREQYVGDRFDELNNGIVRNHADDTAAGFWNEANGEFVANANWISTAGIVPVATADTITVSVGVVPGEGSTSRAIMYYDTGGAWLGTAAYRDIAANATPETFSIASEETRLSLASGTIGALVMSDFDASGNDLSLTIAGRTIASEKVTGLTAAIEAGQRDYFADQVRGYIRLSDGNLIAWAGGNIETPWRSTHMIPVQAGDVFEYDSDATGIVAAISYWDEGGDYIAGIVIGNTQSTRTIPTTVTDAAGYDRKVAFIRASSRLTSKTPVLKGSFRKTLYARNLIEEVMDNEVTAIIGQPLFLSADSMIRERGVRAEWSHEESTSASIILTPTAGTEFLKLYAYPDGVRVQIAELAVRSYATPTTSPSNPVNIFNIGDSTTEDTTIAEAAGNWSNQLSYWITNTGTELFPNDSGLASLNIGNVFPRGAPGDHNQGNPVLHFGYAGMRPTDFLNAATLGGSPLRTNPFWDDTASAFSFDFMLTDLGFDGGTEGLDTTGSNGLCIIKLGYNDMGLGGQTPEESADEIAALVDAIKADRADMRFYLVGLHPAPSENYRAWDGDRLTSPEAVYDIVLVRHALALKAVCAARTNCTFVPVAPHFDPEEGYETRFPDRHPWGGSQLTVRKDYVHPSRIGSISNSYALLARMIRDDII